MQTSVASIPVETSTETPCDSSPIESEPPATESETPEPSSATNGTSSAGQKTTIAGDDFGTCNPTMKFEGGLGGRPATEFTFQSQDPAIIAIQEEALNPSESFHPAMDALTFQISSRRGFVIHSPTSAVLMLPPKLLVPVHSHRFRHWVRGISRQLRLGIS